MKYNEKPCLNIIEKGLELHKKVLDYLNNKVLTEEDLDF